MILPPDRAFAKRTWEPAAPLQDGCGINTWKYSTCLSKYSGQFVAGSGLDHDRHDRYFP